jgi:phosphate uptake regulator
MVKSMIVEAISALLTNNKELALDVSQRDNEVDRMNLLVTRQFAEVLRSRSLKKVEFDSITSFNYMQAASSLERIADHAAKIAEIASLHECVLPDEIKETLHNMGSILGALIDDSISVLLHGDSDKANRLIDNASDIRKKIEIMVESSRIKEKEDIHICLVVASSSIERMLDYIKNLGELAINLCNMHEKEI